MTRAPAAVYMFRQVQCLSFFSERQTFAFNIFKILQANRALWSRLFLCSAIGKTFLFRLGAN